MIGECEPLEAAVIARLPYEPRVSPLQYECRLHVHRHVVFILQAGDRQKQRDMRLLTKFLRCSTTI